MDYIEPPPIQQPELITVEPSRVLSVKRRKKTLPLAIAGFCGVALLGFAAVGQVDGHKRPNVFGRDAIRLVDANSLSGLHICHVQIRNQSPVAIASISYKLEAMDGDRQVPVDTLEDSFDLAGGIEPNETKDIGLGYFPTSNHATSFNVYAHQEGHWIRVTITSAKGINGESIFDGKSVIAIR